MKKVSLEDDRSVEAQASKISFDPELEPLLAENPERFVIFPINYQGNSFKILTFIKVVTRNKIYHCKIIDNKNNSSFEFETSQISAFFNRHKDL